MIEKMQSHFRAELPVEYKSVNEALRSGEEKYESVFAHLFDQLLGLRRVEENHYLQVNSSENSSGQVNPDIVRPARNRPDTVRRDNHDEFAEGGLNSPSRSLSETQPGQSHSVYEQSGIAGPSPPPSGHSSSVRTASEQTRASSARTATGRMSSGRMSHGRGLSARALSDWMNKNRASLDKLHAGKDTALQGIKGRIQKHTLLSEVFAETKKKATEGRARLNAAFDLKKTISDSIRMGRLFAKVHHSRGLRSSGKEEVNEKEGTLSEMRSVRDRMSALTGKNAAARVKVSDGSLTHLKQESKEESGQHGKEAGQGGREITFVAQRYESSIPKVLLKPDYHLLKNADEIFDQIVRQFSFIMKKGGGEAHLVLEPELLGRLKMDIRLNQREVHSFFLVDNQSVKDLIVSRLNILEQSLLQHGFSLGSFQVEVNDRGARFSPESHEQAKRRGGLLVEDVSSPKPVSQLVPEWISTVINVTA